MNDSMQDSQLATPDLKSSMKELQIALLQNPAACALMLPEDIGKMVEHLYKLTGKEVSIASEKKTKDPAVKKLAQLSPADIAKAMEEGF
jgi:hypothetical protein